MQRVELQPTLQLLVLLELLLQPQIGLTQLLQPLVDGLFRMDVVQLLPHPLELQQQGQLVAQEVEEQPIIGLQRLGGIDEEVGEILLLLAQGQAVPILPRLVSLDPVGAVAERPDEVIAIGELCRVELLQALAVEPDQQHVADCQHLAQHGFQLGEQCMLGQAVSQPHDAADLFYLLLPLGIPLHEGGGLSRQLGAGLGLVQPFGQTLQQQPQGGQVLGCRTGQQPLYLAMLHRLHAPSLMFIEPGELLVEAGLFTPQLLLEVLVDLMFIHPVQAGIRQPQHGKMSQGAEPAQLLEQPAIVLPGGSTGRRKIHDGGDDRQQGRGVVRCGGLD
ncbi:hypothetical protein D3C85_1036640 [compost metagenome]